MDNIVKMENITKIFPGIIANDNVNFDLRKGEIHALLGENGAGKSTLMSILFGFYKPDGGHVYIDGEEVNIKDPNVANSLGIGMVHQHFKLVENFTVVENIILGLEPKKGIELDYKKARQRIVELSKEYNLKVDPDALIEDIPVSMQQKVEILKMLYRDARIFIFDEPSAVLTPQEIESLIEMMKIFKKQGKSVILITHKLKEIKAVADRCTILRHGKYIDTVDVDKVSGEDLADLMVGRKVSFKTSRKESTATKTVLDIKNLVVKDYRNVEIIKNLNFEVKSGEILGIAGIDGNGQSELVEAITGLRKVTSGEVILNDKDITNDSVREKTLSGISHIPQDRHKYGLILDFSLGENLALQSYYKEPFSKNGILNFEEIDKKGTVLIEEYDIRSAKGTSTKVESMSGGNQQKAIIAREVDRDSSN